MQQLPAVVETERAILGAVLLNDSVIDELMEAETFLCFGPDTLAEARNRGYKLYAKQRAAAQS